MNENLLLPREKYTEVSNQYGKSPFTFEIKKGGVLFYFGANHSTDPENHQFPVLREYWKSFLENTKGKEKIVLIEGGLRPAASTEKEAIEKNSEAGYVTYLANAEGIPIVCPDVSHDDFAKTLNNLDKEHWLLASFLRWFESFQRNKKVKEDTLEEISKIIKRKDFWKDVEVTPERFKALYKQYVGKDFNENENQNDLVNPNRDDAVTNKIIRLHSDVRDLKIVEDIEKYWKEGKNIFIVFGSGHLIIQRPAIEQLLN